MKITLESEKILVANKAVDFRSGVNGLSSLVVEDMKQNPNNGLYVFYNKRLDRVKILGWHNNGFIMIYKRLETGKFFIRVEKDNIQINPDQLSWLLVGVDWRLMSHAECKTNAYF